MPGEDGWGMNIAQQGDTLFATVFVYGSDRRPTWYVASSITYSGIQDLTAWRSVPSVVRHFLRRHEGHHRGDGRVTHLHVHG